MAWRGRMSAQPFERGAGEVAIDPPHAGLADLGDFLEQAVGDLGGGVVGVDQDGEAGRALFGHGTTPFAGIEYEHNRAVPPKRDGSFSFGGASGQSSCGRFLAFTARLTILPKLLSRARRSARLAELCASSATSFFQRRTRSASSVPAAIAARHGAARFGLMRAIAETAVLGDIDDIREHLADPGMDIGHLQFAHPGRVQQPAAGRQPVQHPAARRVTALGVVLADAAGGDRPGAGQRVDQGRFPDARRADKRDRFAAPTPCGEAVNALPVACIDRFDAERRHQPRGLALEKSCGKSVRSALVRTITGVTPASCASARYRSSRATFEVLVARGDDEQRIDIRGDQLELPGLCRRRGA